MAVTTNTLLPLMAVGSLGKETIYNDALALLDELIAGYHYKSVAGAANVTLTEAEARNAVLELVGILTGSIAVIVPTRDKPYIVFNNTTGSFTLTVKTAAGTGVLIPQGLHAVLYANGTNVMAASTLGGVGNLTLRSGTAQAAAADTVSLWEADTVGVAGKGGLHVMTEDGTQHVLGDLVGLGTILPTSTVHVVGADAVSTSLALDAYIASTAGPFQVQRHARGTRATPALLNVADSTFNLLGVAYARNAGDSADAFTSLGRLRVLVESKDAQGRMGGYLEFALSPGVSASVAETMRLTAIGNLLLGATTFGTSLAKGFVLGNGTAAATSPSDMTQMWSADQEGVAGQSALHILDETGVTTSIGKGILARRVVEASTAGSGAPNVLTAAESGKILTNEGAAARNYHTLPTAVAGLVFTYVVQDADGMRITAATGDTIRVAAGVTATAGYIENGAQGDVITLAAINATEWVDIASRGTWTPT